MTLPSPPLTPFDSAPLTPPELLVGSAGQLAQWQHRGAVLTFQRWLLIIGGLAVTSLAVCMLCLQFGPTRIGVATIASALKQLFAGAELNAGELDTSAVIMVHIRLPRVLVGFFV